MSPLNFPPDSGDGRQASISVHRTTDLTKTSAQTSTLLAISKHLSDLLFTRDDTEFKGSYYPGTQSEALKTFEFVQSQLRNIIDDQSRWNLDENSSEQLITRALEEEIQLSRMQQAALLRRPRPCVELQARVAQLEDGRWVVWVGAESPTPGCLHAMGDTAAEAMDRFDVACILDSSKPNKPAPKNGKKRNRS